MRSSCLWHLTTACSYVVMFVISCTFAFSFCVTICVLCGMIYGVYCISITPQLYHMQEAVSELCVCGIAFSTSYWYGYVCTRIVVFCLLWRCCYPIVTLLSMHVTTMAWRHFTTAVHLGVKSQHSFWWVQQSYIVLQTCAGCACLKCTCMYKQSVLPITYPLTHPYHYIMRWYGCDIF